MSAYSVAREEMASPSLQKRSTDDGDSGFHEMMDDATTFELLPAVVARRTSSPSSPRAQLQLLQHMQQNHEGHVADTRTRSATVDSGYSLTTPEYSPLSPSPRPILGNGSVGSNASTQPDSAMPDTTAGAETGEGSPVTLLSPSPAGSEEDVSGKESDDAFEDTGSSSPEEDELGEQWNPDLYTLQSQAPHPEPVLCTKEINNRPPQYGLEYHGSLTREDAADLLGPFDGHYLVRCGSDGDCILSFLLSGRMWNYKLFYEDKCHYVGEKRFDDLHELVEDGLITVYLQQHNDVMQVLEKGRDITRQHSKKLRRKPCGRVKGPKGKGKSAYLERLRSGSYENLPIAPPLSKPSVRQMSTPCELESVPMTPNSNRQQSDLDLTTLAERRGKSTSNIPPSATSTPAAKSFKERRAFSSDCLQQHKSPGGSSNRYAPVMALRDVVRAERESLSQSVEVSILSEKAARFLGIAPPKQYKRASMYDPLVERVTSETPPHPRSQSFHPGIKRGKAFDKGVPRDLHKSTKKPPISPSPYYKAHKFKPLTYIHPTWCVICHHFLWGLKMQGLRCQDCGIDIHRQCCAESLDHECNPTKKIVKRMYGVDLTTRVKVEDAAIPNLLETCIQHIENSGFTEEGMYRVSGQNSEILDIKERFDNGDKIDCSRYSDINVVCGAVKLYLRELPIPVISFDAYNDIMKATSSIEDLHKEGMDWSPVVDALKLLPKAHYNVLKYLMEHLHRIDEMSSVNKMTAYNLSVVFAPTLMRSPSEDMSLVKDIPLQRHFVEMLIVKHNVLFT